MTARKLLFVRGINCVEVIGIGGGSVTDTMPRPYGPIADNLAQRVEWTEEFFRQAFARPDFVGWHYCGLIDASNRVPRKQDRQHSGLIDGFGKPYANLQKTIKNAARQLYEIARTPA